MDNKYKIVRTVGTHSSSTINTTTRSAKFTTSVVDNLLKEAKYLNNKLKMKNEELLKVQQHNMQQPNKSNIMYNQRKPHHLLTLKSTCAFNNYNYRQPSAKPTTMAHSSKFKLTNQATTGLKSTKAKQIDVNLLLGRKVANLSRNRFKFIKPPIVRKKPLNRISRSTANRVNIVNIKGVRYNINKTGKQLKRLQSTASAYSVYKVNNVRNRATVWVRHRKTVNKAIASILTINRTTRMQQTKTKAVEKAYCRFYNLFGRCTRGDACTFIHDAKRVSICQRFLRGLCSVENCPYSHNVSQEKIPMCSFFAAGCCNKEKCPYLHVFHGKNAEFCVEFAKGFCQNGNKCNKAHLISCPEYIRDGQCSRGNKCPLLHSKLRSNKQARNETNKASVSEKTDSSQKTDWLHIEQQSFIPIEDKSSESNNRPIIERIPLKIRPHFQTK